MTKSTCAASFVASESSRTPLVRWWKAGLRPIARLESPWASDGASCRLLGYFVTGVPSAKHE